MKTIKTIIKILKFNWWKLQAQWYYFSGYLRNINTKYTAEEMAMAKYIVWKHRHETKQRTK